MPGMRKDRRAMREYKIEMEYDYHGVFCFVVSAWSMADAMRRALDECVPSTFADERMTRLSAVLLPDRGSDAR